MPVHDGAVHSEHPRKNLGSSEENRETETYLRGRTEHDLLARLAPAYTVGWCCTLTFFANVEFLYDFHTYRRDCLFPCRTRNLEKNTKHLAIRWKGIPATNNTYTCTSAGDGGELIPRWTDLIPRWRRGRTDHAGPRWTRWIPLRAPEEDKNRETDSTLRERTEHDLHLSARLAAPGPAYTVGCCTFFANVEFLRSCSSSHCDFHVVTETACAPLPDTEFRKKHETPRHSMERNTCNEQHYTPVSVNLSLNTSFRLL